ncbi:MAG: phosphate acyltransferase, partial [Clostridia bacterium]
MSFIENVKKQAKKDIKTIVLPETEDVRILEATQMILEEGFANIILIGDSEKINKLASENNINIEGAKIVNPTKFSEFSRYAKDLYELRKEKGMTLDQAKELLMNNSRYFATMMVKEGDADGFVSGAANPTSDTLRPALQILKTAPGTKLVSAFFIIDVPNCQYGENGIFIFADCALNENPDSETLAEIAASSAKTFEKLVGKESKVAMLSYSTHGSKKSELT